MDKALRTFLTNENIEKHKEHLKSLRLKYSILEKSIPKLKGAELSLVPHLGIKRHEREEAISLMCDIISHEIYFSSFTDKYAPSPITAKHYGSENAFIYELYREARGKTHGFIYVYQDAAKKPIIHYAENGVMLIPKYRPSLVIDLCEHASFLDYGFEHDRYIENAASHLNLAKLG